MSNYVKSKLDAPLLGGPDSFKEKMIEEQKKFLEIMGIVASTLMGICIIGLAHELKQKVPSISPKLYIVLNILGAEAMIAPFVFSPLVHKGVEKLRQKFFND